MKTKFYAVLASAALIAQAQAGGYHGGGGGHQAQAGDYRGGGGGHFAPSAAHSMRSGGVSSFHSMPMRNFGGGRMIYSGRRFSPVGMGQLNRGNINRGGLPRFGNNPHLAQGRNNLGLHNGANANKRSGAGQVRSGNNLPPNWQNHVAKQRSANWHHDWDRSREHRWHGHNCRFIDGSWVIFDFGFYPWSFGYPYDYYYGYDYNDSGYDDSGAYDDGDYYGRNAYDSSDPYADSSVAAAQERLARQGYYRGEIDGILGPQTRRAIARYQGNHSQRVSGDLTPNTLQALGLRQVASY